MRPFPRAARCRTSATVAVLAASALTVSSLATPAHADDLRDRLKRTERAIKRATRSVDESSSALDRSIRRLADARTDLSAAREDLAATRAQLAAARVRDRRLQAQLDRAIDRLETAQDDVESGRAAVTDQRGRVSDLVTSIYTEGDPELLAFTSLMNAEDPADLTLRTEAHSVIVSGQSGTYDDLSAAEVLLEVRETEVEEARDEVAQRRAEAADHLDDMEALESQAYDDKVAVAALVAERSDAEDEAREALRRDKRRLAEHRRDQARVKTLLRKRAEAARRRALREGKSTAPADSGGFLQYPVTGPVTSAFGYRIHPIYGYWGLHDGTDFGAACGAPLYADADGVVISSYYQTVYGNRLIIDHGFVRGVGLASIYNHATHYVVGVGDRVERGQVIGYVGSTGWSTGCHLHFTVMANGTAVDPMNWL